MNEEFAYGPGLGQADITVTCIVRSRGPSVRLSITIARAD